MRLNQSWREVLFRYRDAIVADSESRQVMKRIGAGLPAQIDSRKIIRQRLHARSLAQRTLCVANEPLRVFRCAARIIADHPIEHLDELLGVVLRANDSVEVVTAYAIEQSLLL